MGKAEKTKQFIIETAAPLFNKKGMAGTTIDEVLAAVNMGKGGFYRIFGTKEVLSHEIADYLLQKVRANTKKVMDAEPTAKGKLFAFMEVYKNPLKPVIDGGCPILNFGVECDDTDLYIKSRVKTIIETGIANFTRVIRMGITNKEFSPDFNADEFALKMFTLMEGGTMVGRVLGSNDQMHMMANMLKKEIESYEIKNY